MVCDNPGQRSDNATSVYSTRLDHHPSLSQSNRGEWHYQLYNIVYSTLGLARSPTDHCTVKNEELTPPNRHSFDEKYFSQM